MRSVLRQATRLKARRIGVFAAVAVLVGGRFRTSSGRLLSVSVAACAAVLIVLYASVAPALAATPETPETGAAEPTSTTAVLHGTLNPKALGQPGSYQFSYLPSATECVPGTLAPSFPTFRALPAPGISPRHHPRSSNPNLSRGRRSSRSPSRAATKNTTNTSARCAKSRHATSSAKPPRRPAGQRTTTGGPGK